MASLSLKHIFKVYQGGVKAVNDFNLEIEDKEFIVFVGPSGCGKSTTLRMIAGLEEISDGELYIDGRLVNDVEPKDRDIAMVFQNYALYPHMTVFDNMAFGLKLRRMPMAEINARVKEAAQILGIEALLTRKPKALSGGQRQRVALGRAIVREPKVFLLDEPLSNLDAKLRVQMRTEITKLHHKLATTFIYVTHDQVEAMTMGTRIVVMKDGIMQQVDSPQNLYDYPCNLFVAGFIGTPQMNFIPATLIKDDKGLWVTFGNNKILIPESKARRLTDDAYIGKDVIFGVRPEDIHDEEVFINSAPDAIITARIEVMEKLGSETMLYMQVDGKEDNIIARVDARTKVLEGEEVKFAIDAKHIHLFDPETELAVMGAPTYNLIPAKLIKEGDDLFVRINGVKYKLPEEAESRIVNRDYINNSILVGVKPGNVISDTDLLEGRTDILTGKVEFSEKFSREVVVYVRIEGKDRLFAFRAPLSFEAKQGATISFGAGDFELFTPDRRRIRAVRVVPKANVIHARLEAVEGKGVYTLQVGKAKLTVPDSNKIQAKDPAYQVWIAPEHIVTTKEAISANSAGAMRGEVIAVDSVDGKRYAFVQPEASNMEFAILVDSDFNAEAGDRIKFAIKIAEIEAGIEIPRFDEPAPFVDDEPAKSVKKAVEEKVADVIDDVADVAKATASKVASAAKTVASKAKSASSKKSDN